MFSTPPSSTPGALEPAQQQRSSATRLAELPHRTTAGGSKVPGRITVDLPPTRGIPAATDASSTPVDIDGLCIDLARYTVDNSEVKINVGGVQHITTLSTLNAGDSRFFRDLLAQRSSSSSSSGELFIDRDGQLFRHILQYLRSLRHQDHSFIAPADTTQRRQLLLEAQHYQLDRLVELLETPECGPEPPTPSRSPWLSGAILRAKQVCRELTREWQTSRELHELKDLVLQHLVGVPLEHRQSDLARYLASAQQQSFGEPPTSPPHQHLLFTMTHFPVGDMRYELAAAVQSTSAIGSSPPAASGPYYRATIREVHGSCYVREEHVTGEGLAPQVVDKFELAAFREEIGRYNQLHKLLTAHCSRSLLSGLLWLLQREGFSSAQAGSSPGSYQLEANTYTCVKGHIALAI